MKLTRQNLTFAFLAVVAILAAFALSGNPLVDPAALAGMGMLPVAMSGEIDLKEINRLLVEQGKSLQEFKGRQDERIQSLEQEVTGIAKKLGREQLAGGRIATADELQYLKSADGKKLPIYQKGQSVAASRGSGSDDDFSLAQYCRDAVIGSAKASSGPALVPTGLGSQIIDKVRAQTVLVESGAGTILIDGPTTLARLTQDPLVYQHTEGADDIEESDVLATPVQLNPKLLVALVPLTAELVEDSPNLDAMLKIALANSFAQKIDIEGLETIFADTGIPDSSVAADPAKWSGVAAAVTEALALGQRLPTAHISNPADFMARAMETESVGGAFLGKPSIFSGMFETHTTGIPAAGTAVFGNFSEAFAIAMRSDLRVEVIRWNKPGSATHLLVAHARAAGVVLQPGKLFKQLKTV